MCGKRRDIGPVTGEGGVERSVRIVAHHHDLLGAGGSDPGVSDHDHPPGIVDNDRTWRIDGACHAHGEAEVGQDRVSDQPLVVGLAENAAREVTAQRNRGIVAARDGHARRLDYTRAIGIHDLVGEIDGLAFAQRQVVIGGWIDGQRIADERHSGAIAADHSEIGHRQHVTPVRVGRAIQQVHDEICIVLVAARLDRCANFRRVVHADHLHADHMICGGAVNIRHREREALGDFFALRQRNEGGLAQAVMPVDQTIGIVSLRRHDGRRQHSAQRVFSAGQGRDRMNGGRNPVVILIEIARVLQIRIAESHSPAGQQGRV